MKPLVVMEAFGELPSTDLVAAEREREQRGREDRPARAVPFGLLHSAFDARAELMAWSSPRLWETYEAKLTAPEFDSSLIGWVYVEASEPLSTVFPPLVQCLDDSLRRIGAVDVSGFQVTIYGAGLQAERVAVDLYTAAMWFTTPTGPQDGLEALISFDGGLPPAENLLDSLRGRNTDPFNFALAGVVDRCAIRGPGATPFPRITFVPSDLGVSVRMPEWTASAVGWVLAAIVETVGESILDVENFVVRITRAR